LDCAVAARFLTYKLCAVSDAGVTLRVALLSAPRERQAMMKSKNVVAALRRDVSFVWHAVIAVVFIGFAGLAVGAALLDLLAMRQ
jgi:hypothetical protein